MNDIATSFLSKSFFLTRATWISFIVLLLLSIYYLVNIGNRFIAEDKKIKINNKKIFQVLALLIGIYIVMRIFQNNNFLYDIFTTLIISIILAYAFNPIIDKLENKNINRRNGILILYISIIAIFFIFAFLIIPKSGTEIKRLINNFPKYIDQASEMMDDIYTKYYSTMGGLPPLFQGVEEIVMENIVRLENMIINGLEGFVGSIIGAASKLVNIILTPILTYYFLVDKRYFKEKIINIIPKKYKKDTIMLSKEIDTSLTLFIRGRLLMSLYVGVATTIMLLIIGVDFAIVIGFITGFADIIPYIGPLLGYIPAVFFAAISNPIKIIWVSIFFLFIQWAENNILAPKIIGESMDMHPLIILLSIIIGGGVFGVFGMILSVPVVAIIKIILNFIIEKINFNKINSN
jgi:predicted PurR-regulated permease PerM